MSLKVFREVLGASFPLKCYFYIERGLIQAYLYSLTHRRINCLLQYLKNIFSYSFLGASPEIKQTGSRVILENSCIIKCLFSFCRKYSARTVDYFHSCLILKTAKDIKSKWNSLSVSTISVFMVISLSFNIAFSLILKKEVGGWGYLMRGLFLFAACAGAFYKELPSDLKANSILLTQIFSRKICPQGLEMKVKV